MVSSSFASSRATPGPSSQRTCAPSSSRRSWRVTILPTLQAHERQDRIAQNQRPRGSTSRTHITSCITFPTTRKHLSSSNLTPAPRRRATWDHRNQSISEVQRPSFSGQLSSVCQCAPIVITKFARLVRCLITFDVWSIIACGRPQSSSSFVVSISSQPLLTAFT